MAIRMPAMAKNAFAKNGRSAMTIHPRIGITAKMPVHAIPKTMSTDRRQ